MVQIPTDFFAVRLQGDAGNQTAVLNKMKLDGFAGQARYYFGNVLLQLFSKLKSAVDDKWPAVRSSL